MRDVGPLIGSVLDDIVGLGHENPELGYEESGTAQRVLRHIEKIDGLEIRTGVAETGIVATLGADNTGPCVALRADMDALPIEETNDLRSLQVESSGQDARVWSRRTYELSGRGSESSERDSGRIGRSGEVHFSAGGRRRRRGQADV